MPATNQHNDERILVLAPTGGDSANAMDLLQRAGFVAKTCQDLAELCDLVNEGAGACLIAEEALSPSSVNALAGTLEKQPSWSDIPIVAVTSGGDTTQASMRAFNAFGSSGNITLVERPFRAITLVSILQTALRARQRQYQVRDLMENLERRVIERTTKLEQTISELEAFSYSVSHDLRGPLRAMQGYSHFLMEDYGAVLDENGKDYLRRIINSGARLDRLVQDILTYSRFARKEMEIHPIDLEKLVKDIVQQYPTFQPPKAEIEIDAPLVHVLGHDGSMTQCVSNLLSNAVKFMPPDRVPHVKIWTDELGADARFYIQDNGIGIEETNQDRIFKMFERGRHATDYEGTGIGLAIVHKAVERMGGKVGVESMPGEGSRFWIQLPKA